MLSVLVAKLRQAVVSVTKATLEAALVEELSAERCRQSEAVGRRSGYFTRILDTEHGRIEKRRVPKLRSGNKERSWQILERYQRGLGSLINFTLSLYCDGTIVEGLTGSAVSSVGQRSVRECHQSNHDRSSNPHGQPSPSQAGKNAADIDI